jgi:hypothetical protein
MFFGFQQQKEIHRKKKTSPDAKMQILCYKVARSAKTELRPDKTNVLDPPHCSPLPKNFHCCRCVPVRLKIWNKIRKLKKEIQRFAWEK